MCSYVLLLAVSVVLLLSVGSSEQLPIPVSGVARCGPWHGNYSCPDRINASGSSIGAQFCSKWGYCGMTANYSASQAAGIFLSESLSCELDSDCAGAQLCDRLEYKCCYVDVDAAHFLPTYQLLDGATAAPTTTALTPAAPTPAALTPAPTPGSTSSPGGSGSGSGSDESTVQSLAVYAASSPSQLVVTLLFSFAIFL